MGVYYAYIGLFFVAVLPVYPVAAILAGISVSLSVLFGGVFLTESEMGGWGWFYYCFANSHALRLQALPQFFCSGSACPSITINGVQIVDVYAYVSGRLGEEFENRWHSLGWILFIIFVFRLVGVLALRRIDHSKR